MNFDAFIQDIKNNNWTVYGVEVYEDKKLTHSFGNTFELHEIYSSTKTILSIALGIAYDEGLINLDSPVLDYLPSEKAGWIFHWPVKSKIPSRKNSIIQIFALTLPVSALQKPLVLI